MAALVAFIFVSVTLPNTDKATLDISVTPARTVIRPQPALVRQILVMAFLPVLCIFTLGRRWPLLHWLAWTFLAILFVGALLH